MRPGAVVVGTESHTTSHGALGAFAFGIGATEMASVWTLGIAVNVEVPATIKVNVRGRFKPFVGPKDLILHLISTLTAQGANFKVLEFHGETIRTLPMSGRLVICNMSVEAGATAGIVPADAETERYLREEAGVKDPVTPVLPDADASYVRVIDIDVSGLEPQIACPHTVDNVKSLDAVAGTKVHQVVIGSCTNGRLDDLEVAASLVRGPQGGPDHADARVPGVRANLLQQAVERRACRRFHARRRRRDEPRMRPLPRRPRRRSRRRGDCALHNQPELQGPHGQPEFRSVSLLACSGRRVGGHGRDHRSPQRRDELMAKVVVMLGDDISTDVIYPGRYMATVLPFSWKRRSSHLRT